jgi:hypothetical protein
LYFFGDNVVSWQSQKQRVVALSSCEAEYIATVTALCQGMWLGCLFAEIRGEEIDSVTLKIDKHIDTRYHYIRHYIDEGRVQV